MDQIEQGARDIIGHSGETSGVPAGRVINALDLPAIDGFFARKRNPKARHCHAVTKEIEAFAPATSPSRNAASLTGLADRFAEARFRKLA
jgi:hypothetical protein